VTTASLGEQRQEARRARDSTRATAAPKGGRDPEDQARQDEQGGVDVGAAEIQQTDSAWIGAREERGAEQRGPAPVISPQQEERAAAAQACVSTSVR